jgi:cyclohexanone monooxygenase
VESLYYSYSFSGELEQEWQWTERYPGQPEVLRYLNHVADRFGLRRDIQFGTRVSAAAFDEAASRWEIRTGDGGTVTARFLITAVGCLSTPNVPGFPGLGSFAGDWYHTGRWPHEGVGFAGKRVGVIGTGSTGIQAIPVIAAEADQVTVFQRTPNYTIPACDAPLDPATVGEIKAGYPVLRQQARLSYSGMPIEPTERSALEATEEERRAIYEAGWQKGGFYFLFSSFSDLLVSKEANDTAAEFVRSKIRETVHDPAVAELLSPRDHPYGTKRPPVDTGYYETYNRDNVSLVSVRESPIQEITPKGLRTADADYEFDTLVFATGFDAMTGALLKMDIRGRNGMPLRETWKDGPSSYLGLQVAGFPNLFTITGPCSPSVLSNMVVSIEQHVEWIADCIAHLGERGLTRIEATPAAQDAWVAHTGEVASATLYPLANSWYVGANIPGKKRVFMPYAGGVGPYRQICDDIAAKNYQGFAVA